MSEHKEMMYMINVRWYLEHEDDYEEYDYDEWDYIGGEEYEYAEEEDYGDEEEYYEEEYYEEEDYGPRYATGYISGEYNIFEASRIIASLKLIEGMQGTTADYWLTPSDLEDPSPWMK